MLKRLLTRYDRLLLPDPADQPTLRKLTLGDEEVMYVVVRPYRPPKRCPIYSTQVRRWPTLSVGTILIGSSEGTVTQYRLSNGTVFSVRDADVEYRGGKLYSRRRNPRATQLERPRARLRPGGLPAEPMGQLVLLMDPEGAEGFGLGFRYIRADVVRPYDLTRDRPSAWERLARDTGGEE